MRRKSKNAQKLGSPYDAPGASRIDSGDGNFPVPRINRDRKVRPAITKGALSESIAKSIGDESRLANQTAETILFQSKRQKFDTSPDQTIGILPSFKNSAFARTFLSSS
jgi:hypothetical protein